MGSDDSQTLDEELSQAWDEAESELSAETTEAAEEVLETVTEDAIEEVTEEAPSEEAVEQELPALEPHPTWPQESKEAFAKLPREGQELVLDQYKNMYTDYQRKTAEVAGFRRQYEAYQELIKPHEQRWNMQGYSPEQGVRQALAVLQALEENPQEAIARIAESRGLDLGQMVQEQPYVDPALAAMQQQVQELRQALTQRESSEQQQSHQQAIQQVRDFAGAVDESGNRKHPHFERVYDDMITLVEMGRAKDLDSAYQMAVKFNDDIQAELQSQETQKVAQITTAQTNKAKEAAKAVESKSTDIPEATSFVDELDQALSAAGLE